MATEPGGASADRSRRLDETPQFPGVMPPMQSSMPAMPPMPDYPFLYKSQQGASLPVSRPEGGGPPSVESPIDPDVAIASSHVTLDPSLDPGTHQQSSSPPPRQDRQVAGTEATPAASPVDPLTGQIQGRAGTPGVSVAPYRTPSSPRAAEGPGNQQSGQQLSSAAQASTATGAAGAAAPAGAQPTASSALAGGEQKQTGHSGEPAANQQDTNIVSDKATEVAGHSEGDVTGAPRSDQALIPAGPYLQFLGYDVSTRQWHGSIAVVLPPLGPEDQRQPVLTFIDEGKEYSGSGRLVEPIEGWSFWRFDIHIQLGPQERSVQYTIRLPQQFAPRETMGDAFVVPSTEQTWHWGFHSCNGLSVNSDREKWGTPHLWQDVLNEHDARPLHAVVGGGDQVYNDAVWKSSALTAWLESSNNEEKYTHEFTSVMEAEATQFYFNHYREHFSTPLIAKVMSCIPQVMVWDDHDIWDGWGSYPHRLQTCPVFVGLYLVARRTYLLFQHHTTNEAAHEENDMFGPPNTYSFVRMFGPKTAVLGLDSRSERTTHQVMSKSFYDKFYPRMEQLPKSTEHVVCVHTVPLIFPSLPLSEKVMSVIEGLPVLKGAMTKTGVGAGIIDKFGHAELLDDITDHWDASTHLKERADFIQGLQRIAKAQGIRVSFLGGDVHVCAVGRLYTHPKVRHLRNDHRFMPQVTSSAVWNNPPPSKLVTLLHKTNKASKVCPNTREKMVRLFKDDHPKTDKVLDRRNWLDIAPVGTAYGAPASWRTEAGALVMTLRVEDPDNQQAAPALYPTIVPRFQANIKGMRPRLQHKTWPQRLGCASTPQVEDPLEEL